MSTNTPVHTAAYKLFKYPFRVAIPAGFISSIAENRALGAFTSGNPNLDRIAASELTPITCTIAQMVDFYKRSVTMRFESTADCVRIYEIILEHINDFKAYINAATYVSRPIPFEDLRDLDDFAGQIFVMARGRIAERTATTLAINSLETKVASILAPRRTAQGSAEAVMDEIVQSHHKPEVSDLERAFQARLKPWQK